MRSERAVKEEQMNVRSSIFERSNKWGDLTELNPREGSITYPRSFLYTGLLLIATINYVHECQTEIVQQTCP